MRRIPASTFLPFILVWCLTSPALGAGGKERLKMPFDCSVKQDRLFVRPSAITSYEIVGSRTQQTVTACERDGNTCTSLNVQRFEILCGKTRVPWMYVAHAAAAKMPGRRWIEKGRLGIIRPARAAGSTERWMLPAGYAPLGEAGAKIEVDAPADAVIKPAEVKPMVPAAQTEVSPPATPAPAAVQTVGPANAAATVPPQLPAQSNAASPVAEVVVAPAPRTTFGNVLEARDLSDEPAPSSTADDESTNWMWWIAGLVVLLSVTAAGIIYRRNPETLRVQGQLAKRRFDETVSNLKQRLEREPSVTSSMPPGLDNQTGADPALANAAWQAATLLDQIEQAVSGLDSATPLRDVLLEELGSIHQRLVATRAAALEGGSAAKAASQYRALIRELERVRRIADSAANSFSNARPGTSPPKTKSEAYALLGVNADVSENILKKLVDALRMTWHPDHARNEQDRLLREDRIKQINIAWDIICDKRHAA